MFSKISRYRPVPDIAPVDPRGRVVAAKDIRPLPEVTGTFTHTVDSGDRLDQLAFTFYGQPLQYWHICDANPQFTSPLALLGQEPVITTEFPVRVASGTPPWADLLGRLSGTVGVDGVTVVENVTLVPQAAGGVAEQVDRAVLVTYNRISIDAPAVAKAIKSAGFSVGPPADRARLGQQIIIPPPPS
jgi:hypothetical protein